jgi:hypothetical protein
MAIESPSELLKALGNNSSRVVIDKSSIANMTASGFASLWRTTGQPGQGAIPGTTPTIPTSATLGAMGFTNQVAPVKSYLGWFYFNSPTNGTSIEIHDRLAHVGGLSLNINTQQNITGMDLGPTGLNLVADRRGDANYSDVQWWLECYADGGATASNLTINVTYDDGTSGSLNVVAVGGTLRAGRMIPLTQLIPTAQQGKFIRGINFGTLSVATGTAGNFGFTATRMRTAQSVDVANKSEAYDWAKLGFSEVPNDACLFMIMPCVTTSTGLLRGGGKIAHG